MLAVPLTAHHAPLSLLQHLAILGCSNQLLVFVLSVRQGGSLQITVKSGQKPEMVRVASLTSIGSW